jgi:uncharacterized NAD(P)/FAD-binding protein YdhS
MIWAMSELDVLGSDPRPGKARDRRPRIGIVGAGFTGTMLAVHLLKRAESPLDIFLIERSAAIGTGIAYSTQNARHLLNVRVANMSAFEDDPAHFLKWLWAKDLSDSPAAGIPPSGHAFVSRRVYGLYLEDALRQAIASPSGEARLSIMNRTAIGLFDRPELLLRLDHGDMLPLDRIVLCVGNFPPAPVPGLSADVARSDRYIADPWDVAKLGSIKRDDSVLTIGSGLTTIDVLECLSQQGHSGSVHVVSRRGLIPHRHEQTRPYTLSATIDLRHESVLTLLRTIRSEIEQGATAGFDWRSVLDALRPHIRDIWQNLPVAERNRFLRHIRPYWDVHRHRMAPQVANRFAALLASGRVGLHAGSILDVRDSDRGFDITLRRRRIGRIDTLHARWIVNCSGPQCDYARIADPFVRNLLATGLVRRDALDLGLDVTANHAVIRADGSASPAIFALGPPTKGAFWEITAVPDIRRACEALASQLLLGIGR